MLTRRAAFATAAAFALTPSAAFASRGLPPGPVCAWPAVRARFMAVGRALRLPAEEVAAALTDDDTMVDTLIEWAKQHDISIDWVLTGPGETVLAWWECDDVSQTSCPTR